MVIRGDATRGAASSARQMAGPPWPWHEDEAEAGSSQRLAVVGHRVAEHPLAHVTVPGARKAMGATWSVGRAPPTSPSARTTRSATDKAKWRHERIHPRGSAGRAPPAAHREQDDGALPVELIQATVDISSSR